MYNHPDPAKYLVYLGLSFLCQRAETSPSLFSAVKSALNRSLNACHVRSGGKWGEEGGMMAADCIDVVWKLWNESTCGIVSALARC